jgi:hypothetical protein
VVQDVELNGTSPFDLNFEEKPLRVSSRVYVVLQNKIILWCLLFLFRSLDGYCQISRFKSRVKLHGQEFIQVLPCPFILNTFEIPSDYVFYVNDIFIQIV